jgi:hypothetical protein
MFTPADTSYIAAASPDVVLGLLDEIERMGRENAAHRALAMLQPKEMSYADRSEFERLKRADIDQGKCVAELIAKIERLRAALDKALHLIHVPDHNWDDSHHATLDEIEALAKDLNHV